MESASFGTPPSLHDWFFAGFGCPVRAGLELQPARMRMQQRDNSMAAFFLWCILFVLCWPLAIVALFLYPLVWLFLLPFRIVGIAVDGVLALVWALVMLPFRLLTAPFRWV